MSKSFVKSPVKKSAHPVRDHTQEWAWIAQHGDAYRGQWVMVRYDKLLAADSNIRSLLSRVPPEEAADAVVWYLETEKIAIRLLDYEWTTEIAFAEWDTTPPAARTF
jgi:hypothetical protein